MRSRWLGSGSCTGSRADQFGLSEELVRVDGIWQLRVRVCPEPLTVSRRLAQAIKAKLEQQGTQGSLAAIATFEKDLQLQESLTRLRQTEALHAGAGPRGRAPTSSPMSVAKRVDARRCR